MFYSQKLPNNTKSLLRVRFSDFSRGINTNVTENLLPLNYAVNSFNFDFNSKSLSSGLGLKELTLKFLDTEKSFEIPDGASKILRCWTYSRYSESANSYIPLIVIYCDNGNLYFGRVEGSSTTFVSLETNFAQPPHGINYRIDDGDCFFAFGNSKIMKFDGSDVTTYTQNVPSITSVALHAGRLFATVSGDENKLMFSDDLNPTNWNISAFEGGYIELTGERGRLKKVIEANNHLYIIREYGISRLNAWGLQGSFTVQNLYLSTGKLYYNSAVLCGNTIFMLCKDGIYYFSNGNMQKLELGIDKFFKDVENDNAVGAFLDGKYYLACRMNFDDDIQIGCENSTFTNNVLLEFDLNTQEINLLRGVDVSFMFPLQVAGVSKLMVCLNDQNANKIAEITHNGEVFGASTYKYWQSPFTDMGYPNFKKVIKNLVLNTKSNIEVLVSTEDKTRTFSIKSSEKPVKIPINIIANKFSIAFKCQTGDCEISNPQLEVMLI